MFSNCKHQNIVSLLGFCDEGPEMILVYEFCPNGSLDEYFGNTDNVTNLTWAQRIQISIDIAQGLKYLHTNTECRETIIHRDIKSANILLDENWVAKNADFGLSRLHHACQQGSTLITYNIAGTDLYLDPEYLSTGKLKTKSDIYSFGVVLFEIMCGKLAYDKSYNDKGLPSVARQCFTDGMIKNLVDLKIKEADENISMLNGGKNSKDNLHMSLKALKLGTRDFSDSNCIGEGRLWKLYQEVPNVNGRTTIIAKWWDSKSRQGHRQFLTELEILFKYRHTNIIGFAGYCNEMDEKVIVYEHAKNGRLDKHLDDATLTWTKRPEICINIASGLKFIHEGGVEKEEPMKHIVGAL
ncbi:receptor-like protein kinase ANXUR2 [Rutidosis leptorrhynchoides]|uniref:receptor-like protein kinase ANXUR2 n=1 Tax=Rutidosis leptorrhynchoides TaxID=125765 RepID=UPI003A99A4C5